MSYKIHTIKSQSVMRSTITTYYDMTQFMKQTNRNQQTDECQTSWNHNFVKIKKFLIFNFFTIHNMLVSYYGISDLPCLGSKTLTKQKLCLIKYNQISLMHTKKSWIVQNVKSQWKKVMSTSILKTKSLCLLHGCVKNVDITNKANMKFLNEPTLQGEKI
jgi:hypothetical protein